MADKNTKNLFSDINFPLQNLLEMEIEESMTCVCWYALQQAEFIVKTTEGSSISKDTKKGHWSQITNVAYITSVQISKEQKNID